MNSLDLGIGCYAYNLRKFLRLVRLSALRILLQVNLSHYNRNAIFSALFSDHSNSLTCATCPSKDWIDVFSVKLYLVFLFLVSYALISHLIKSLINFYLSSEFVLHLDRRRYYYGVFMAFACAMIIAIWLMIDDANVSKRFYLKARSHGRFLWRFYGDGKSQLNRS